MARGNGQVQTVADSILYGQTQARSAEPLPGTNLDSWLPSTVDTGQLVLNDYFIETTSSNPTADPDLGWVGSNLSWMARVDALPEQWAEWIQTIPKARMDASAGSVHNSQKELLALLEAADVWQRSEPCAPLAVDDSIIDWQTLQIDDATVDNTGRDYTELILPSHQLAAIEQLVDARSQAGWEWRYLRQLVPEEEADNQTPLLVLFDPDRTLFGAVLFI